VALVRVENCFARKSKRAPGLAGGEGLIEARPAPVKSGRKKKGKAPSHPVIVTDQLTAQGVQFQLEKKPCVTIEKEVALGKCAPLRKKASKRLAASVRSHEDVRASPTNSARAGGVPYCDILRSWHYETKKIPLPLTRSEKNRTRQ